MNWRDTRMRGPRRTEGRVNWNYRSDGAGASSYGRSGYMDAPPNFYSSNTNPIAHASPNPNPNPNPDPNPDPNPNPNHEPSDTQ